jgi:hypothetical protein
MSNPIALGEAAVRDAPLQHSRKTINKQPLHIDAIAEDIKELDASLPLPKKQAVKQEDLEQHSEALSSDAAEDNEASPMHNASYVRNLENEVKQLKDVISKQKQF